MRAPFRERYLTYDELTETLHAWQRAYPDFVRLESLTTTPEGRAVWLLTLGPEPDRTRPAAWVDGNMHASELAGSSVALAIAEDVIRLHTHPDEPVAGLPARVRETLRTVLFHVLPRMSPDGAEAVLRTGRFVRSVPRDERPYRQHPRWVAHDVDGDGLALLMRQQDPTGELVESRAVPGLLVPREPDDEGPYYKLYPEGHIENFDGRSIPSPHFLSDNELDLNRSFPRDWRPEHEQVGAGPHPMAAPESRAVVEWASRHPNVFLWLNLHTFGGVLIRPLGDAPDTKMDPADLALFRQIERWATETLGYPTVSGYEEFLYEPEKPLRGDLSEWAYHHRGAISWVTELWDLFERVGLERKKRFVDRYTHLSREDLERIARWDAAENAGRVFRPWKPFEHPQIGPVEIGGLDPRVGIWNPPYERLDEVCRGQSALFLRVAALAPRLVLGPPRIQPLGPGAWRIEIDVENHGYLPTHVLASARKLPWNEPLAAFARTEGPARLASVAEARQDIGHLDGWGRPPGDGLTAVHLYRSRGTTGRRTLAYTVEGRGLLHVRVGSCRTGHVEARVELG
ncbi:MAG: M14 family metallopeptidase [Myxococcota bacterium]|nr:M14 family metallopeptidase [Myxococcota bacterium]